MTRDEEIKLKVATIIDGVVGEKKKTRRRLLVWAGSACAAILIASIAFASYLNNSPPEPPADAPQGKITFPPPESVTARTFQISEYIKNIPFKQPYIWLIVDEKNLSLIFHEFDSYICKTLRREDVPPESGPRMPDNETNGRIRLAFR